ncbi:3-keto-5-aminohexanoate cleavage protein [Allomesorhizobium camelthorni]|uniref:3-keto-5-aminohexanoate cleavage protein n=1 Tax=Allomesorhizobium camelthorni TaxID=475069 RepID=A0A6G4WE87_9HYPH|nr:3-keto-5-aminohexanoate cleavage protein [Mesorhizobium camelthorni]NGO52904.1 3-keto-5-aminohexanoate cleavage protein [Mesorhizobium camelthorni]
MGLNPSRNVFITCAVTGSGDTTGRSDKVPVTPRQIADASIEAANAGAAIAHIHVRDPQTGKGARDVALYEEVLNLIKQSGVDMVINFTAGMGGDLTLGNPEQPLPPSPVGTDMVGATERLAHVRKLLPEICTLDCGTMNFGEQDYVMTNTPPMLKAMAAQIQALGVKPEVEIFDTGHLLLAKWLHGQGLLDDPVMVQLCMGIPWGAPDDIATLTALTANLPSDWIFSAFSIGRNQMPYTAVALAAGGNIRVGLEDNIWLDKGVLATNGALVERAVKIAENMGSRIMGPEDVRKKLKLTKRW